MPRRPVTPADMLEVGQLLQDGDGKPVRFEEKGRDQVESWIQVTFPPTVQGFYRARFKLKRHGWYENASRGTLFIRE